MDGDYSYLQVADSIAERIAQGEFEVAYQTVRRSMKVLRERGLIITRQGRGTFVAPSARVAGPGSGDGQGS
jgi:DNA-binding GntR family transcriptional regulator